MVDITVRIPFWRSGGQAKFGVSLTAITGNVDIFSESFRLPCTLIIDNAPNMRRAEHMGLSNIHARVFVKGGCESKGALTAAPQSVLLPSSNLTHKSRSFTDTAHQNSQRAKEDRRGNNPRAC